MTILDTIIGASSLSELSGGDPKAVYKKYSKKCHPDLFSEDEKDKAHQAFTHLNSLYRRSSKSKEYSKTIKTKRHEYTIQKINYVIDNTTRVTGATYDDGHKLAWVSSISTKNTDLFQNAVSSLKKLDEVPKEYSSFFPNLLEKFKYKSVNDNIESNIIVTEQLPGFVPLYKVLESYPDGISGRNVAWIFRRMLVSLGNTHSLDLIHGAPTLSSFWINVENHGLILDNWIYSRPTSQPLLAVPSDYKNLYPTSALTRKPVDASMDLEVAAKSALSLLHDDEPAALKAFFKGCVGKLPEAKQLLHEFEDGANDLKSTGSSDLVIRSAVKATSSLAKLSTTNVKSAVEIKPTDDTGTTRL